MGDALLLFNISRPQRLTELSNVTQMASRTLAGNSQASADWSVMKRDQEGYQSPSECLSHNFRLLRNILVGFWPPGMKSLVSTGVSAPPKSSCTRAETRIAGVYPPSSVHTRLEPSTGTPVFIVSVSRRRRTLQK